MTATTTATVRPPEAPAAAGTSLRSRLTLIVAVALAPFVVIILVQSSLSAASTRAEVERSVVNAAAAAASPQRALVQGAAKLAGALVRQPTVAAGGEACSATLRAALEGVRGYSNIAVYSKDGRLSCSTRPAPSGFSAADEVWFAEATSATGLKLTRPHLSRLSGGLVVKAVEPVGAPSSPSGILVVNIPLGTFDAPGEPPDMPAGSWAWIVSAKGDVLVGGDDNQTFAPQVAAAIAAGRRAVELDGPQGRALAGIAPLIDGEVFSVLASPRLAQQAELWEWAWRLGMPLGMLALAAAIVWWSADRLVLRWTGVLRLAIREFGAGRHLPAPGDLAKAPAEFQDLFAVLERMSRRIEDREGDMRRTLAQREVLLKEIHHRVKNNLQIVSSLLSLQANAQKDAAVRGALDTARSRINALATIHRRLYEKDDLTSVDVRVFVDDLCKLVAEAFSTRKGRITVRSDAESFSLPADTATPLGLFIVEALTNAYRHAYPGETAGRIDVRVRRDGADIAVAVEDFGAGLDALPPREGAMGRTLIEAFARQLRGQARLEAGEGGGTRVALRFPAPA